MEEPVHTVIIIRTPPLNQDSHPIGISEHQSILIILLLLVHGGTSTPHPPPLNQTQLIVVPIGRSDSSQTDTVDGEPLNTL